MQGLEHSPVVGQLLEAGVREQELVIAATAGNKPAGESQIMQQSSLSVRCLSSHPAPAREEQRCLLSPGVNGQAGVHTGVLLW